MFSVVEVMGLEPTASSMRPKRSSQLSYTPAGTLSIAEATGRSERADTGRVADIRTQGEVRELPMLQAWTPLTFPNRAHRHREAPTVGPDGWQPQVSRSPLR